MFSRKDDMYYAMKLANNLKIIGFKMVVAESCTAGGLSYAITRIKGASQFFDCGYVTYSDAAKEELLDINPMLIEKFNSVSETISREMAIRALSKSKTDLAISVTGVASYSDKYSYKDIGLVWFSIAKQKDGDCVSRKQIFKGSRDKVREQAISYALKWLKEATEDLKL